MQSLQARIRQLEADNASLATAAEQAAALAEEYAGDAARYRAANNSTQTALVNELTDATRRKDRRIQRLTAVLEAEKTRAADSKRRLEELEEMTKLANEKENDLRGSVRALQSRTPSVIPAAGSVTSRLSIRVLSALETLLPSDFRGIFAAFRVFFTAESIRALTSEIALAQNVGKTGDGFAQLASVIEETACRAVAWCFESPEDLSNRSVMLDGGMSILNERVEALSREVIEGEPHRWTAEYLHMKQDLVAMPLEVLKSVVPASWTRIPETDIMNFEEICRGQAKHMNSIVTIEERELQAKVVAELKSKLNVSKLTLEQRNKELDDLRVRVGVFENKLKASLKKNDTISTLQDAVKSLESELAEAKVAPEQSSIVDNLIEAKSIKTEKETERKEVPTSAEETPPREQAERLSEVARLRKMLVQSQLADLQTATSIPKDTETQLRDTMQIRNAVSMALHDARTAASTASIVRLDPHTLEPKIEGTTMSRKTLLQSLSVLETPTGAEQLQQDLRRFATLRQTKLLSETDDFTSLIDTVRELIL